MSIDLDIDYTSELAAFAKAEFQLYFLMHTPGAVSRKEYSSFGGDFLSDAKGYNIRTYTLPKPQRTSSGGVGAHTPQPHVAQHLIQMVSQHVSDKTVEPLAGVTCK